MEATFYILLAITIVLASCFVIFQGSQKRPHLSIMLKTFASVCVVALALYGTMQTGLINHPVGALFVVGLVCCLVGDILLQLFDITSSDKHTIINMGSFAFMCAHFCFIVAMAFFVKSSALAIILPFLVGIVITLCKNQWNLTTAKVH